MIQQSDTGYNGPTVTKSVIRKLKTQTLDGKQHPYKLLNQYRKIKKIGDGPYSQIKLMLDTRTNQLYAMKKYNMFVLRKKIKMSKNALSNNEYSSVADEVKKQVEVWSKASRCAHVARLHEIIDDQKEEKLYLFMDFCEKGDIARWDSKAEKFVHSWTLLQLAQLIKQAAHGLAERTPLCILVHAMNIVHRDIKPLNLLVTKEDKLIIVDFGLSVALDYEGQRLNGTVGTYQFNSPQMLSEIEKGGYDARKSDVWALGVSLFGLLFGSLPFSHELLIKLFEAIEGGKYTLPEPLPKHTQLFVPLIQRMLNISSKQRPTSEEVRQQLAQIEEQLSTKM